MHRASNLYRTYHEQSASDRQFQPLTRPVWDRGGALWIDRESLKADALYRFHCTDGHELVTDLCGSRLPDGAPMRAHAERVALALMERVVERFDWSGWQVEVYDAKGRRVWIRAFPDVNVDTRAA